MGTKKSSKGASSAPAATASASGSKSAAPSSATSPAISNDLIHTIPEQDNTVFRLVDNWKSSSTSVQTFPPTVPIKTYSPVGETQEYANATRRPNDEKIELSMEQELFDMRKAAEVHRNVRKYAQSYIRPGMSMIDICTRLEKKTLELVGTNADWSNYMEAGYGFPTGCSLNHVAAHYTPNYGDKTVLTQDDICKLDFGVHVNGRIMDCAFTIAFDPIFDPLIQATKDATNAGIKEAGIDARFGDIGEIIDGKYLKITDRKKELFKTSGGKYVAPQPVENKMKESPFIEQIVLVGDNKKMVTALVVPSFAKLREWAKQNGVEYTSNEEIIQHATVLSMFESIIAEYNLLYNQVEQVKKFTLIPREFTIDQGEMTPKLSIRRKQVLANFEKEIDLMYQG
jgi:acyl-CoA synthetase (AMP-forming)/AMP-acid ligase II